MTIELEHDWWANSCVVWSMVHFFILYTCMRLAWSITECRSHDVREKREICDVSVTDPVHTISTTRVSKNNYQGIIVVFRLPTIQIRTQPIFIIIISFKGYYHQGRRDRRCPQRDSRCFWRPRLTKLPRFLAACGCSNAAGKNAIAPYTLSGDVHQS